MTKRLPLDAVILSLCLLGALVRPADAAATRLAVVATFLLGLYWVISTLYRDKAGEYGRRAFRAQLGIALALIGLVVVLPAVTAIGYRHTHKPWNAIHDSALQIELATGMLLHGQDYYRATYFHTPLAQWWPVGPPNPALYHTDSLPFQEELTVPAMLAAQKLVGFFDERMIYLVCLGLVLGMAASLARAPSARLALVAGLGLNPLFVPTFIAGQNDVLVLAEVMGALLLARAGRRRASLLLLGIALATKETAVFLLPFLLLWMAGQEKIRPDRTGLPWLLRALSWTLLPVAVFVGPFLLWDGRAFLDSGLRRGDWGAPLPHPRPGGLRLRQLRAVWPPGALRHVILAVRRGPGPDSGSGGAGPAVAAVARQHARARHGRLRHRAVPDVLLRTFLPRQLHRLRALAGPYRLLQR